MNKIGMKIWLLVGWLAIVPQLNGLDQTISIPDIKTFIVSGQSAVDFIEIFNTDPVKSEYTGTIKPQGHYQPAGRSSRSGKGHTWYTYTFQIKDANSEIIQSLNIGTTQTAHIAYTTSGTPSSGVPIINLGDRIIFKKISSGPAPKTVTITIPAGTANFKNVNIMDGNENPDIVSLFNGAFSKDLLTNGLTVTGVIVNNGINWTYSGGTTSSSTKSKPIELDMYFNPGGGLKPQFNIGDTIEIVGIKPKTVTITIPAGTANFKNVNIMDGNENPDIVSLFNGAFSKDLLTNGLTVTGVIVNNGINWTYSGGTTSSSTKSKPIELDMYFNPGGGLKPQFNIGDTIEIVGFKTTTIQIPSEAIGWKSVIINKSSGAKDITSDFNKFTNDLMNNGKTVTGILGTDGIDWTYSSGKLTSAYTGNISSLDIIMTTITTGDSTISININPRDTIVIKGTTSS